MKITLPRLSKLFIVFLVLMLPIANSGSVNANSSIAARNETVEFAMQGIIEEAPIEDLMNNSDTQDSPLEQNTDVNVESDDTAGPSSPEGEMTAPVVFWVSYGSP